MHLFILYIPVVCAFCFTKEIDFYGPVWVLIYVIFYEPEAAKKEQKELEEPPIEENINRLQIEGEEARSVTQALSVLRWAVTNHVFLKNDGKWFHIFKHMKWHINLC